MTTIQKHHKLFIYALVIAFVFVSLFCIRASFAANDQGEKPFQGRTQVAESIFITSDILNPFFSASQSGEDISKLSFQKNILSYFDREEEMQLQKAINIWNVIAVLSLGVILFLLFQFRISTNRMKFPGMSVYLFALRGKLGLLKYRINLIR